MRLMWRQWAVLDQSERPQGALPWRPVLLTSAYECNEDQAMDTNLDRIIRSLETVLANGHALVPVPHKDLRILIEAARHAAATMNTE